MENQKLIDLFNKAEEDLENAQNELNRPAFDVVKYSACVFGRIALHRYLSCLYAYYTGRNKDEPKEHITIEDMLTYCRQYNDKLKEMKFEVLHCVSKDVTNTDEVFYCNDLNQVNHCKDYAADMRALVLDEIWDGNEPVKN